MGIDVTGGLDQIATALRASWDVPSDAGGLKNTNFYNYFLDGFDQGMPVYYKMNNGSQMSRMIDGVEVPGDYPIFWYDESYAVPTGGAFTEPYLIEDQTNMTDWTLSMPPALGYEVVTESLIDEDFKFVSLGYVPRPSEPPPGNPGGEMTKPLTMLGTRLIEGNPSGFKKAGYLSLAPWGGEYIKNFLYSGATINGFTVYAWYRVAYGYDNPQPGYAQRRIPNVLDLYLLMGHPSWGSVFDSVVADISNLPVDWRGSYCAATGPATKNILAITSMLSCPFGETIATNELEAIVNNYCTLIGATI